MATVNDGNILYFFNRTKDGTIFKTRFRDPVEMKIRYEESFDDDGNIKEFKKSGFGVPKGEPYLKPDELGHNLKDSKGEYLKKINPETGDCEYIYSGACVADFSTSLGWSGSASSLNITIIEEDDWHTPLVFPKMGTPHHFQAGDFTFNGLLKSVTRNESASGGIKYSVVLESPNALLDGAPILTDVYSVDLGKAAGQHGQSNYPYVNFGDSTNNPHLRDKYLFNIVPNLLNVFKLYESPGHSFGNPSRAGGTVTTGFGAAWNNSQGMRWVDILWGLTYLLGGHLVKSNDQNDPQAIYQQWPGLFTGDLDPPFDGAVQGIVNGVPIITGSDPYTAIGGGLYYGDYTYTVDFTELANLSSTLGDGILPDDYRTNGPTTIMGLVQDLCDAASADFFIELQDDLYTIKIKTITRVAQPELGTIESYVQYGKTLKTVSSAQVGEAWANNTMGKLVVGDNQTRMMQETTAHQIYGFYTAPGTAEKAKQPLISTGVQNYPGIGSFPKFAIQIPQSKHFPVGSYYICDELEMRFAATKKDAWEKFVSIYHPNKLPSELRHPSVLNPAFILGGAVAPPVAAQGGGQQAANAAGQVNAKKLKDHQKQIDIIYSAVSQVYSSFYGQKYLVPLPFFQVKFEDSELVQEWDIVGGAYDFFNNSITNFVNPSDVNFYDNAGLKVAYVTYPYHTGVYDYRGVQQDSWAIEGDTVYVKATVEDKVIWHNSIPHAVVTTPHVKYAPGKFGQNRNFGDYDGLLSAFILGGKVDGGKPVFNGPGGTMARAALSAAAKRPVYFAIPQKSTRHVYGPWIGIGGIGKCQFEADTSLAPQNFGNPSTMATFGAARATAGLSYMDTDEHGSVEIVGLPSYNLGTTLINNGPYISDINVSVGVDKITTRYAFKTWDVDFGKLSKFIQSSVIKNVKDGIKAAKNFRSLFVAQNLGGFGKNLMLTAIDEWLKGDKKTSPGTPHWFMSGQVYEQDGKYYPYVITETADDQQVWRGVEENWPVTAAGSLDCLFVPYGTSLGEPGGSMYGFTTPTEGDIESPGPECLTSKTLNPWLADGSADAHGATEHSLGAGIVGESHDAMPENLSFSLNKSEGTDCYGEDVRTIGLRGPMVLTGWGFNVDGTVVGTKTNFAGWRSGPVDLAWDNYRGIWTPFPQIHLATMKADMKAEDSTGEAILGGDEDQVIEIQNHMSVVVCKDDPVYVYYRPNSDEPEWWILEQKHHKHELVCDISCSDGEITVTKQDVYIPMCEIEGYNDCESESSESSSGGGVDLSDSHLPCETDSDGCIWCTHPNTGELYKWFCGDGSGTGE